MAGVHRRFAAQEQEKFPFQSRGDFKVAFGAEYIFMAIIGVAFIAGLAGILIGAPALFTTPPENEKAPHFDPNNPEWKLFCAILELAGIALLSFLCLFALKIVLGGKTAHYDADNYRFCVTVDGEKEVFFYNEIASVTYDPIMFLGKIRGYSVDIRTSKSARVFSYRVALNKMQISPNPDSTPFVILEEKAELRKAGQSTVYAREEENMTSASLKGMSAPDMPLPSETHHSVTDKMDDEEYLQYLRSNVSEIKEIRRSPENAVAPVVDTEDMTDEEYLEYLRAKKQSSPAIPEISRPSTLSHDIASSAMPSISAEEMPAVSLEKTGDISSAEKAVLSPELNRTAAHQDPRFKAITAKSSGVMRVAFKHEKPILTGIKIVAAIGFVDCIIDNVLKMIGDPSPYIIGKGIGITVLFCAVWFVLALLFTKIVELGRDISYETDTNMMILKDKRSSVILRYEDVISVKFYPLKRGFAQKGWEVNIVTSKQTYTYGWLFTGKEYVQESETPFNILQENIPRK